MCKWIYTGLVLAYLLVTIMITIVLWLLFGWRMANGVRWVMTVGWFGCCFGGIFLVERLGTLALRGCRPPIRAEEERLTELMAEIQDRVGSTMHIRFLISGEAEKPTRSFGYRTILIQSSVLTMASDEELKAILARELGHLRDGDRVMDAAFATAGIYSLLFPWWWRLLRRGFGFSFIVGSLLLLPLFPLLPFFLLDGTFRAFRWGLRRQIDYRQDRFAFRAGCGDGLRAWLEKSGLAANVHRIRRLEKMQ